MLKCNPSLNNDCGKKSYTDLHMYQLPAEFTSNSATNANQTSLADNKE